MAQRVITLLVSDLSGDEVDETGETVEFSVRGVDYRIDLTAKEAQGFDKSIAIYVEHATRLGGRKRSGAAKSASNGSGYDAKQVRAWAKENDVSVPDRGRIPGEVLEQYKIANG